MFLAPTYKEGEGTVRKVLDRRRVLYGSVLHYIELYELIDSGTVAKPPLIQWQCLCQSWDKWGRGEESRGCLARRPLESVCWWLVLSVDLWKVAKLPWWHWSPSASSSSLVSSCLPFAYFCSADHRFLLLQRYPLSTMAMPARPAASRRVLSPGRMATVFE